MVAHWAQNLLGSGLRLHPGERFLALVDQPLRNAGEALCATAGAMGANEEMICMPPSVGRPMAAVSERLLQRVRTADVIISLLSDLDLSSEMPILRAAVAAFRSARRGRWAFGACIDDDVIRHELSADCREVARIARQLAAKLAGTAEVRIVTESGTDMTLRLGGRPVHSDTGILTEPGAFGNLPAGEAYVAPLEHCGEGRVVVDLSLGDLVLREPVTLTFRNGRVTAVEGGEAGALLRQRLGRDPWAWTLGEFGMGANPHARIRGRVTTDEKVLGTAHIALGANMQFGGRNSASTHYDCVIGAPRIYLDGQPLLR